MGCRPATWLELVLHSSVALHSQRNLRASGSRAQSRVASREEPLVSNEPSRESGTYLYVRRPDPGLYVRRRRQSRIRLQLRRRGRVQLVPWQTIFKCVWVGPSGPTFKTGWRGASAPEVF